MACREVDACSAVQARMFTPEASWSRSRAIQILAWSLSSVEDILGNSRAVRALRDYRENGGLLAFSVLDHKHDAISRGFKL